MLGFAVGLLAMAAIALGHSALGLVLFLLNRLADGLDGAVARQTRLTDLGGFLDIVLDFILYSGVVFAFAVRDPARDALAAAFLIFSFVGTGTSFLAFAIMAAKRGLSSEARGRKSLYYLGGLDRGHGDDPVLRGLLPVAGGVCAAGVGLRGAVLGDDRGANPDGRAGASGHRLSSRILASRELGVSPSRHAAPGTRPRPPRPAPAPRGAASAPCPAAAGPPSGRRGRA